LIFLVNYGEEIGWRGYALPSLMQRFNPLTSSLLLGVIWALFHIPIYIHRPAFGLMTALMILSSSIILTWMFIATKKILPGTLFHATLNTWTQVFFSGSEGMLLLSGAIFIMLILAGYLVGRYGKGLGVSS
jgi:membrane protease YdiL (CAAX protease family)